MPQDAPPRTARRTDFDLLRAAICLLIILAHALLIFAAEPRYHVKSSVVSPFASWLYEPFRLAATPIFFVLAGWSAVVSLRRRGGGPYLRERVARILLPLGAGIALLGPIIKYIELREGRDLSLIGFALRSPTTRGFFEFLAIYPIRPGLYTWSHLWFLAYLFLLSIVLLPVFLRLARRAPAQFIPGPAIAWLPVPIFLVLIVGLRGYWPFLPNIWTDAWNVILSGLCMLIGGVLAVWPGLETRLRGEAWRLMSFGAICCLGVIWFDESLAGRIAVGLALWGLIGGVIGLVGRYPPRAGPVLTWLAEASMPIYIIHHVPVLLIGRASLDWAMPVAAKIVIIFLASAVISCALYEYLIRPFALPRLLTGLGRPA